VLTWINVTAGQAPLVRVNPGVAVAQLQQQPAISIDQNHPGDPGIHLRTHEEAAYRPGTVHGTLAPSSYQVMQVQPCQRPEASHKRGSPKRGKKEKPGSRPLSEGGRLAHGGRVLRRRNRLSGYDPISQDRYCLTSRTG